MAHPGHGEKGLRKPFTPANLRYGAGPLPCQRPAFMMEHRERHNWYAYIRNDDWIDEYDFYPPGYIPEGGVANG